MSKFTENEIAREIVDAAFHIHRALGPGLLETVYEVVLARELEKRGLSRCSTAAGADCLWRLEI